MPTNKKSKSKEIYHNNNLPVFYVDNLDTRHRQDGVNYLSFKADLPDIIVEQVRLIVTDEGLHNIIDDMCLTINYFPKKPSKKATSNKQSKSDKE